jgi:hypothetical protein
MPIATPRLARSAGTLNEVGGNFLRGMSHYSSEVPRSATFPYAVCQMAQNEGEYTECKVRNMALSD